MRYTKTELERLAKEVTESRGWYTISVKEKDTGYSVFKTIHECSDEIYYDLTDEQCYYLLMGMTEI